MTTTVRVDGPFFENEFKPAMDDALDEFFSKKPELLPKKVRPPANVTGRLRNSWYSKRDTLGGEVGSRGVPYAIYQERGTFGGTRIKPKRMLARQQEPYTRALRKLLSNAIRKRLGT